MISRETGNTKNEADLGEGKDLEVSNYVEKSIGSGTLGADYSENLGACDGSASDDKNITSSIVLSDVELYKISFQ